METQVVAVAPSNEGRIFALWPEGEKNFQDSNQVVEWLRKQKNKAEVTVLYIMGGPGQELFVRIMEMGIPVFHVPIFRAHESTGLVPKASVRERANALLSVWQENHDFFYPMRDLAPDIELVRELTRQRLSIQEDRKKATNRLHSALRRLQFILPEQGQQLVLLLRENLKKLFKDPEIRERVEAEFERLETEVRLTSRQQARLFAIRRLFSNPQSILGAKADEEELEERIRPFLRGFPIWPWMNPGTDSVLPAIKGLGPSLGGSIISEIGDIRRFPKRGNLRAYGRFHLRDGAFPKRVKGQPSEWNNYFGRAVWLWSTDQAPRYDHVWRLLYLWKKAKELQKHQEVVPCEVTDKKGRKRIRYDYTLKHLDARAKRWLGSQLLNYLFDLWTKFEGGQDLEVWYSNSTWPDYFARIEQELGDGLLEYLKSEIPKRRRTEPKPPPEFEEEDYEDEDGGDEDNGDEEE